MTFPGGGVDPEDLARATDFESAARIAALRELREESGIDLPESVALEPAGRWATPDYAPIRYDTQFFLTTVSEAPKPQASPSEYTWLRFLHPETVLNAWRNFELLVPDPTRMVLEALAAGADAQGLQQLHGAALQESLEFQIFPAIRCLPLLTPTLPPALHTNTYILGHQKLVLVDPATPYPDERLRLQKLLSQLDGQVTAVFLTHHHPDHVGAALWAKETFGVPIWAHPRTKDRLLDQIPVDHLVNEGDHLDLGMDAQGRPCLFRALHTPGHAEGHLVLEDIRPGARALIVGDMIASIGTIIVDPDEGSMAEYIRQLKRLNALPEKVLLPAHGFPVVQGHRKISEYVAHRQLREDRVLGALQNHPEGATAFELLKVAYADTPPTLWPLAERSCLAHLIKLVEEQRAEQRDLRFYPCAR